MAKLQQRNICADYRILGVFYVCNVIWWFLIFRNSTKLRKLLSTKTSFANTAYGESTAHVQPHANGHAEINGGHLPVQQNSSHTSPGNSPFGWKNNNDQYVNDPGSSDDQYDYSDLGIVNKNMSSADAKDQGCPDSHDDYGAAGDVYNHLGQEEAVLVESEYSHITGQSDYDHLAGQ